MEPRVLIEAPPPADERLFYGAHPSQFVDFRRGVRGRPLVIMIHGGFWRARYDLVHAGHLCAALAGVGYVCANVEYRRAGEAGGGWPGTFDDVKLAVAFAREHASRFGGDAARTVVMGHSAGGHLALWVAAEVPDLAGVIGLAPVTSLHQTLSDNAVVGLMGGTAEEVPERYAYGDAARATGVPRVLIHGNADEDVPVGMSRGFAAPCRLIEIPSAGHFDLIDPLHGAFAEVLKIIMGHG